MNILFVLFSPHFPAKKLSHELKCIEKRNENDKKKPFKNRSINSKNRAKPKN